MARVCAECGASNTDTKAFCGACAKSLSGSSLSSTKNPIQGSEAMSARPWIATSLIAVLVLCCLCLLGITLLDELMASHPLRTLVMVVPTPTATRPATATSTPTATSSAAPTYAPTPQGGTDTYEADDTRAQASLIETDGTAQTHTLNPAGDRDYVFFQARGGTRYTIETGNLGLECDTIITLNDEDGAELRQDDDGGEETLASRLSWTAREDGRLFVEVRQFDKEVEAEGTEYDIWVSESEPLVFEADEYEPDNTLEQANQLTLDVPQTHNVHLEGDPDWLLLQVEKGSTYVLETLDLGAGIDTIIYLYDEGGDELVHNDDSGEDGVGSRIIWTADSTGVLYVMVRDYWDDTVAEDMEYTISFTESELSEADDYEPDDTQDQASEIEVGSFQTHNLHVTGDQDWVCFQATAGTDYIVETLNLEERIDTHLSLYDSDGEQLAEDDDSGPETLSSGLSWSARESGTLCLLIRDLDDEAAGPGTGYAISVQEGETALLAPDRYEPDDTLASAGEIAVGGMQQRNIHAEGDHDWLSFRAEEGVTYLVETSHLGEDIDTIVFLYNEDSEELARDDDGGEEPRASSITWTAQDTGTVYVMARDYKDDRASQNMQYSISVYESYGVPDARAPAIYIADGAYHVVTADTHQFAAGVSQLLTLENFSLEVDAAQVSGGNDNEYGLVFGYQDDDNYYELAISGDGYAGFFAKERGRWDTISAFSASSAINQGNAVNRLRLEALEGSFSFYVNGQLALQEFDDRFTAGLIGFGCGSFAEPSLHCTIDNLRVWDEEVDLVWEDSFDDNSGEWYQSPVR